jgi:hypothetical protein
MKNKIQKLIDHFIVIIMNNIKEIMLKAIIEILKEEIKIIIIIIDILFYFINIFYIFIYFILFYFKK